MAYFYVKNSLGTRTTGGGLTKQTGSFSALGASNVYATIEAAITDGATSGDFVCVSDAHSYSNAGFITYLGPETGDFLTITTVSDSNCDTEATAASVQEYQTSNDAIRVRNRLSLRGLYLKSDNDISYDFAGSSQIYRRCIVEVTGSGDYVFFTTNQGCHLTIVDCELKGVSGSSFILQGGCVFRMYNCVTTGIVDLMTINTGIGGGAHLYAYGCDFSSVTGSLIASGGNSKDDDVIDINFVGCKLNATEPSFYSETFVNMGHRVTLVNTSGTSASAEYQYHTTTLNGSVDDETSFYRDGSTAFPSGQKVSLKCVTTSGATKAAPFVFDFPTRYSALSSTSTDNITIYLLSSATLYDSDVWVDVVYPDGTNKHTPNFITTEHSNVLDTNGTALSTNTEAWTGRTTENRYQIDIDTSADAGADSVPIIRVYVAKASTTIYFCPTIGLS